MAQNSIYVEFAQSDVQEVRLNGVDNLEIILSSGEVIGFTDIAQYTAQDNSFIFFSDGGALPLDELVNTLENAQKWNVLDVQTALVVSEPLAGEDMAYDLVDENIVYLNFDVSAAKITQASDILDIDMGENGRILVKGVNGEEIIRLADGEVVDLGAFLAMSAEDSQEIMAQIDDTDMTPRAVQELAQVEPAAGNDLPQDPSIAELAAIEPAAGDAGAPQSGRGGYGFESRFQADPVNPIDEIGPIDPTALQYGIELRQDQVFPEDAEPARTPTPPEIDQGSDNANEIPAAPTTLGGTVPVFFGADGFGSLTPGGAGFATSGSLAGGNLTSLGEAVIVTETATGYEGATASGRDVFTFNFVGTGDYEFIIHDGLDHADPNDPSDVIVLEFGLLATDGAGDNSVGSFLINVIDSVPTAVDDQVSMTPMSSTVADGNVVTGVNTGGADSESDDIYGSVTNVNGTAVTAGTVVIGTYGTLSMDSDGEFDYVLFNNWAALAGVDYSKSETYDFDSFTYTFTDADGDSDTATLSFDGFVNALPPPRAEADNSEVTEDLPMGPTTTGNFYVAGANGGIASIEPKSFTAPTGLESNGVAVVISETADGWVGMAGTDKVFELTIDTANESYEFELFETLDHADEAIAANDFNFDFTVEITDNFGLTTDTLFGVRVIDDVPVANDDLNVLLGDGVTAISDNVTDNDEFSADADNLVASFVPLVGTFGTLSLDADGEYTYTLYNNWADLVVGGVDYSSTKTYDLDTFTYTLTDGDSDSDTATLSFDKVVNALPEIEVEPNSVTVTEDRPMIGIDDSNSVLAYSPNGDIISVSYNGTSSVNGGTLSSNGSLVTLKTNAAGTIIQGHDSFDNLVFEIEIINNSGLFDYEYTQYRTLDHQEGGPTDDMLTMTFGVTVEDEFGITANSTLSVNVNDDNPLARSDSYTFGNNETQVLGNVVLNDHFSADDSNLVTGYVATGTYGAFSVDADGDYSYSLFNNWADLVNGGAGVDYATGGTYALDTFSYALVDGDGDTSITTIDFSKMVNALNPPVIAAQPGEVKEDLPMGPSDDGSFLVANVNGTVSSLTSKTNGFSYGGSSTAPELTSNGVKVDVSATGTGYVGMAGAVKVFEITFSTAPNKYDFELFETLDHADATDPTDVIELGFDVVVTDSFGLSGETTLTINVIDDAPVAYDDSATLDKTETSISGSVTTNDAFSADDTNLVNGYSLDGVYGSFTVGANGAYTYTLFSDWATTLAAQPGIDISAGGTFALDSFDYILKDGDLDPSTATIDFKKTIDGFDNPTVEAENKFVDEDLPMGPSTSGDILVTGANGGVASISSVAVNGFSYGGSSTAPALSSEGVAVVVNATASGYVGMAGSTKVFEITFSTGPSKYDFELFETLDHADATDPNDLINLNFKAVVTDGLGLSGETTISVGVYDDAPVAKNDPDVMIGDAALVADGNVLDNDELSADDDNFAVAKVYNGTYGDMTLFANGDYIYTVKANWADLIVGGVDYSVNGSYALDTFTYTMKDGDLDPSSAQINFVKKVTGKDDPDAGATDVIVKEDLPMGPHAFGNITVTGANGGVASIKPIDGSFSYGGSSTLPVLSHNGQEIIVSTTLTGFVGMVGALKIFELNINEAAKTYKFELFETLDHADPNDPVDEIDLKFKVKVTDNFGLSDEAEINVTVIDDNPIANDDSIVFTAGDVVTGNVVTPNDELSADMDNKVTKVKFGGNEYDVPQDGSDLVVKGDSGTLTIDEDGNYEYDLDPVAASETTYLFSIDNPPGSDNGGDIKNVTTVYNKDTHEFSFSLVVADPAGKSNDGFTVAINNGPNPKGHGGEMALFYFDASGANPVVSAYAYNGHNTQTSWKDGSVASGTQAPDQIVSSLGANSPFTSITVSTDAQGNNVYSFSMDASAIINHLPDYGVAGDWSGVAFDDLIGMWLHPIADINSSYDADGFLTSWNTGGQGWYDSSNQITEKSVTHNDCVGDVFEYVLTDSDGDSDPATLSFKALLPQFVVGQNVDDIVGETTPYAIGEGEGAILGGCGHDVLIGDVGGTVLIPPTPQDYNFVFILDTSGSMGTRDDASSRMSKMIAAVDSLMDGFADYDNGAIRLHFVPFGTNSRTEMTFDITDQASADAVKAWLASTMEIGGTTNYEAGLRSAIDWLEGPDALNGGAETYTYFISDGAPNRYLLDNGNVNDGFDTDEAVRQYIGTGDSTNETAELKALSTEVIGVGIELTDASLAKIDYIDSDQASLNITNPDQLTATLKDSNPITGIISAGSDVIDGGHGNDVIFGDSVNTDALAVLQGIAADQGAGWDVFTRLEGGEGANAGWDRDDTLAYIADNLEQLGSETILGVGVQRDGGDDTLSGGQGNDVIFGQEGNDVISGGEGNDILYGGSGSDTFLFESITEGRDTIKDFDLARDQLDLSELIEITDPLTQSINDFVFANDNGAGGTVISVDENGSGNANNATALVDLDGLDVDLNDLMASILVA